SLLLLIISSSNISFCILFFPCFRVFCFLSRYRSALPATFLLPAYPLQGSSPFGVFCFLYDNLSSHKLNGRLMFGPSFLKKVLRPLLTSVKPAMYHYKTLFLRESLLQPATV